VSDNSAEEVVSDQLRTLPRFPKQIIVMK